MEAALSISCRTSDSQRARSAGAAASCPGYFWVTPYSPTKICAGSIWYLAAHWLTRSKSA